MSKPTIAPHTADCTSTAVWLLFSLAHLRASLHLQNTQLAINSNPICSNSCPGPWLVAPAKPLPLLQPGTSACTLLCMSCFDRPGRSPHDAGGVPGNQWRLWHAVSCCPQHCRPGFPAPSGWHWRWRLCPCGFLISGGAAASTRTVGKLYHLYCLPVVVGAASSMLCGRCLLDCMLLRLCGMTC